MLNATRIRLYPTAQQAQALAVQFGCARWVWNNALDASGKLYLATGKGLNYHAMSIRLPKLKQEFEWLGNADSQALQQSLQNLSRAFENFLPSAAHTRASNRSMDASRSSIRSG